MSRIRAGHAGLLILTLRDLLEGDIQSGFGRSKGFGSFQGKITTVTLPQNHPDWMEECLSLCDNLDDLSSTALPLSESQVMPLEILVDDFNKEVKTNAVS